MWRQLQWFRHIQRLDFFNICLILSWSGGTRARIFLYDWIKIQGKTEKAVFYVYNQPISTNNSPLHQDRAGSRSLRGISAYLNPNRTHAVPTVKNKERRLDLFLVNFCHIAILQYDELNPYIDSFGLINEIRLELNLYSEILLPPPLCPGKWTTFPNTTEISTFTKNLNVNIITDM